MLVWFWCEDAVHHGREGMEMEQLHHDRRDERKQVTWSPSQEAEKDECCCWTHLSPVSSMWDPIHGALPPFKVDLPSSADPLWKCLPRHI